MRPSWQAPEVTLAFGERGSHLAVAAAAYGLRLAEREGMEGWQLSGTVGRISIRSPRSEGGLHLDLESNRGPLAQRLRSARRDDALPRACGLQRRRSPLHVVDATAGLGRDALILAHLGCRVDAIERIPALAFLAHWTAAGCGLAAQLMVHVGEAGPWLAALPAEAAPDVVYLDPMFGEIGKAQVKKDMQVCRLLAGPPDDPVPLLAIARQVARERVVVKRHHGAPPLVDGVTFVVPGERIRFDVYVRPSIAGASATPPR